MKYDVPLFIGIFWCAYGIIGLLGYQRISKKFRGQPWTGKYIRKQGLSWLILGVPWLIWTLIISDNQFGFSLSFLALCIIAVPSLLFTFITDKKYNALLKDSNANKSL